MSLAEQTALMSEGLSYWFTAPRRHPGLAAEATVAMAAKAATKMVFENMVWVVCGTVRLRAFAYRKRGRREAAGVCKMRFGVSEAA